jgi:septum formation protein
LLILASGSPRRRDLLAEAGIPFRVETSDVDETALGLPREVCLGNAELKARAVADRFPAEVVLGADTIVVLEGDIYGKPRDLAEAKSMLQRMCGRVHEVLTGVVIFRKETNEICTFVESTRVKFHSLETVDIDAYLRDVHTLDKAGAYAAQDDNGRLIALTEGLLSNVVGLPVERVSDALAMHFPTLLVRA